MIDLYLAGLSTLVTAATVFLGLMIAVELGFRFGLWRGRRQADSAEGDGDVALSSLLAILGLVLAFTYSASVHRSDARKAAVIVEANAIGTAWLRAELAPEPVRQELRAALADYARTRVFHLREVASPGGLERALDRSAEARQHLWPLVTRVVAAGDPGPLEVSIVQAVNDVLDADTARITVAFDRLPPGLVGLLVFLAATSVAVAGYNSGLSGRLRRWRMAALASILAILIATILDYDRALRGFFQVPQTAIESVIADMERSP